MQKGFTLIELAIVLVIIGLIVGGVLVGRDLISAAAVRAQISQVEKYQQAANTFKGKYGYLPGDIKDPEATQFGFATRGQYTGEGDGNGLVEGVTANSAGAHYCQASFGGEAGMFWVDLSAAGLVDGSFSTVTPISVVSTTVTGSLIERYLPKAKISNTGYVHVWCGGWKVYSSATGDGLNYFAVTGVGGAAAGTNNIALTFPSLTAAQAYAIDKKVDDGLPQSGVVLAMNAHLWASGGPIGASGPLPYMPMPYVGDYDSGTLGPVTEATTSPIYVTDNGASIEQTCYNDFSGGSHTKSEHYSIDVNNGTGVNCNLSFRFQ